MNATNRRFAWVAVAAGAVWLTGCQSLLGDFSVGGERDSSAISGDGSTGASGDASVIDAGDGSVVSALDATVQDGPATEVDAQSDAIAIGDADSGGLTIDGGAGGDAGGMRALGDRCSTGSDCQSTWCADGVCCQSQCTESCKACNLSAQPGVCTAVAAGAKPGAGHSACLVEPQSTCGQSGTCDGTGQCAHWVDVVCKAGSCDATTNRVTPDSKCDAKGVCVAPASISCSPYVCDPAGAGCYLTCTAAAQCEAPKPCVGGSCGPKPNGSHCASTADCTTGNCVDGYCCDLPCSGKCEACDLAAAPGTCSPVTQYQPHGARGSCAGTAPCAGACSAASRQACTFPGSSVSCRSQTCSGATLTSAAGCDGSGACPPAAPGPCAGNFVCNAGGTGCLNVCSGNANCAPAAPYCSGGSCVNTAPLGSACTSNAQCQNSNCVDGYCCDVACIGQCEACDITPGTCAAVNSGSPHGSRVACSGSGLCLGTCTSTSRTMCTYPGSATQCSAQTCSGSTQTSATYCNGGGSCSLPTTTACGTYVCGPTACKTSCASTVDCVAPNVCNASSVCAPMTCFVAGTPVETERGAQDIETIQPGDRVRSLDTATGEASWREVVKVEQRVAIGLVTVSLDVGPAVEVSPEHYFWVIGSGWVRARDLAVDDELLSSAAGHRGRVVGLASLATSPTGVAVFNLVVEGFDDYFVGTTPVLVHSCDYLGFSSLPKSELPR